MTLRSLVAAGAFAALAALPAQAGDCGDLPCANTSPPASMNEPYHLGGGSAKDGCVRYMAMTAKGMSADQIAGAAAMGCGMDRALARVIVDDALRTK
jgi:hypothetical protein